MKHSSSLNSSEDSAPERLAAVLERIKRAAERASRSPGEIQLIAVSKHQPIEKMRELLAAGHGVFGENYVQEAKLKFAGLVAREGGAKPVFHCIGNLQRNKVKDAVSIFEMIHSIDRRELAEELAGAAGKVGKRQKILLQIKVSEEETKSGCAPPLALELLRTCLNLPQLEVRGLMCIGRFSDSGVSEAERRAEFQLLSNLRKALQDAGGAVLPELSMGMSEDFELAIAEGATMIRVGTAVFGARPKNLRTERMESAEQL